MHRNPRRKKNCKKVRCYADTCLGRIRRCPKRHGYGTVAYREQKYGERIRVPETGLAVKNRPRGHRARSDASLDVAIHVAIGATYLAGVVGSNS